MSATTPALIPAAAGVGFAHAVMPDHWAPLAVVGRTQRYPLRRIARLSGLAGIAHVLVSVLLGALIIAVGLQFRSSVEDAQGFIVGGVLIATGVAFAVAELTGRGHGHARTHPHAHAPPAAAHTHPHTRAHPRSRAREHRRGLTSVMVPFGAAASPDLTILPVFLAASAAGVGTAIGSLLAFALVTVATIVALTLLAAAGGYGLRAPWLDRWGNSLAAATLIMVGTLVAIGVV
jgi:threonine/homoserine/homoserine lactone efflux protein